MIDKILDKIAELLWSRLEPMMKKAYADGYRDGSERGYKEGHHDGAVSTTDEVTRRMAKVYEVCRAKAKEDAYAEAGAIEIEDISKEAFDNMFRDSIDALDKLAEDGVI